MNRSSMHIYRPEETGALVFGLHEVGTVVSVFDKAVNIRVSGWRLVSVVRHAAAMTPMSILCPALLDCQKIRIAVGQTVNFSDVNLTSRGWGMDAGGSKWFEGFPAEGTRLDLGVRRVERYERILQLVGQKGGLRGVTGNGEPQNAFARKGQVIAAQVISQGRANLASNLAAFAGLGPGFTPSGDDLICGFLMGEALTWKNGYGCPFPQGALLNKRDKAALLQAAEGTSDAGRTLIWMALKGRFPRFLCRAVAELGRAETAKDMLDIVTRATQFGHTSGTDALTGLLLYLKTCHGNVPQNRTHLNEAPFSTTKHISFSG